MMAITGVVQAWLDEQSYNDLIEPNTDERSSIVKVLFNVEGNRYQLVIEANELKHVVSIFLYSTDDISESQVPVAWQWANEINTTLLMGRLAVIEGLPFQYRQSIDVEDGSLSTKMISNVVDYAIQIFEGNKEQIDAICSSKHKMVIEELSDAYSWDQIEGHIKLKKWAENLKKSFNKKYESEEWSLVGRGVIIINEDPFYVAQVLKTVAMDSGFHLALFGKDDVIDLPPLEALKKNAPIIVHLESGRWKREKWDDDEETDEQTKQFSEFKEKLQNYFDNFSVSQPVIFVTSTNDLSKYISDDLKKHGLFDLYMSLPKKSFELIGQEFVRKIGKSICGESLLDSYGKIGHLVNSYDAEKEALAVLALRRRYYDNKKKLEYLDLVDADIHNLIEEGILQEKDHAVKLNTSYHEAGHALINILESEGANVPDYTSILPGASGFSGITVKSRGYMLQRSSEWTFDDYRKNIRVCLAGRVAEEVLAGPETVSTGASSDLEMATNFCSDMFRFYGFSPKMTEPAGAESNLAVISDEMTTQHASHVMSLTREFLSQEYQVVRQKLFQNRKALDEIANLLMTDPIVDQDELVVICQKLQIKVKKQ